MQSLAESAGELRRTVEDAVVRLRAISDETASVRWRGEGTWSRKELLGHLIDSASNNHQRFVRALVEGHYEGPGYAQQQWVNAGGYASLAWDVGLPLWESYNLLLAHVLEQADAANAATPMRIGEESLTLGLLAQDYVRHLRHHLQQLLA